MSSRAAFVCCLASTLYLAFTGCTSDRETRFDVSKRLAPGMSRQEVQGVLAGDDELSASMTYVRNARGVFEPEGPNDPGLQDVAVRYSEQRKDADTERIQKIVARWLGVVGPFGGIDVLYLFYDDEEKLVDHIEGHYDICGRRFD